MNPVEHLNWANKKKVKARNKTIISQYRKLIGNRSIPKSKQYWTLAANQTDGKGNILKKGELDQVLKSGLIVPSQYYGVDNDKPTYLENKQIKNGANWIYGDFYTELVKAYNSNNLNVGIVNYDSLNMPCRASVDLASIMYLLSLLSNPSGILLVANIILRQRCVESEPVEIIEALEKQPQFQFAMRKQNWKSEYKVYVYNGTGKTTATWMGSLIYYLK